MKPIYSEPQFIQQFAFELTSFIGRKFLKRRSRIKPISKPLLLDIGGGENFTDGWVHVDFFRTWIRRFWKQRLIKQCPEVETDLRYPLKCDDNIVDGIYSCHTLEHLYPNHAYNLIEELFRILKPGGWFRIIVPELKEENCLHFRYRAEEIGDLTQNYGHHSVWDKELLSATLKSYGFIHIKSVEFGKEGSDKRLIKEESNRKIGSLTIEAQKPL